jgi:Vitamin K-dependent gamma-carboxylase
MNDAPGGVARRSLWHLLYDFWTRPIRAEPLALFRILIGVVILLSLLTSFGPRLPLDLGPDGLCPGRAADDWIKRSGRFCLMRGPVNLPFLDEVVPAQSAQAWRTWCDDPTHAAWILAVLVAAVVCMTVGIGTRFSTIVAWALFVSFNQRLPWVLNGGDSMMRCALFYLIFAPAGAVWSVDSLWRRRGSQMPASAVLIPPWSVRLMQIQLCLMYLFTGISKIDAGLIGNDWITGEAVYWVLNDLSLTRWPYHLLPVPMLVCRLLSWGTLAFELGFAFVMAIPSRSRLVSTMRTCLLLAGVALHLGILVHTEVGWFSPATLCWYVLFLSGEHVRRFTPFTFRA